jgi:two-component system NarL family sensor kinase
MVSAHQLAAGPRLWREMPDPDASPSVRFPRSGVGRAVAQFGLSGIAALILLGAAGVYLLEKVGRSEAIRNAKEVTSLAGHGIVEPNIDPGLLTGQPAAIQQMDRAVRRGVLGGRVVRVKIWTADGHILYSDEHRLIGSRYPSNASERAALRQGKVEAEVSDLARPENRFERRYGKLLEVYLPIKGPDGQLLRFETYDRYSSVAASGRRLWLAFAPAILGTLALLWFIQLPLAWRVARRLRAGQAERETLLRRAIESSELERRRIARDLHDGAVQSLVGVSYNLVAASDTIDESSRDETAAVMREAARGTRRTIKELRTMLVDIYPPDLHRTGLEAALRDLIAPLGARGIDADVDVPPDLELTPEVEMLLFRVAQEALRNAAAHSRASRVDVRVSTADGVVSLSVEDDGRGFEGDVEEGHLGLRLVADLVRDASGRLDVHSEPGRGTRIEVEAPL